MQFLERKKITVSRRNPIVMKMEFHDSTHKTLVCHKRLSCNVTINC